MLFTMDKMQELFNVKLWIIAGLFLVSMLPSTGCSTVAPLAQFTQLMERSVVPLTMAKIFSLNDIYDAQVCVLNNIFAENKDIPKLCTCSFSRIRAIELMCANGEIYESYDCSKNICETCCTLSMSANELKPGDYPVSCKVRCINSPVASDVTEESRDLLSGLLRKINALYHPEPNKAKAPEEAVVPTKYHVIPLEEQHDDTF